MRRIVHTALYLIVALGLACRPQPAAVAQDSPAASSTADQTRLVVFEAFMRPA